MMPGPVCWGAENIASASLPTCSLGEGVGGGVGLAARCASIGGGMAVLGFWAVKLEGAKCDATNSASQPQAMWPKMIRLSQSVNHVLLRARGANTDTRYAQKKRPCQHSNWGDGSKRCGKNCIQFIVQFVSLKRHAVVRASLRELVDLSWGSAKHGSISGQIASLRA